MVTLLASIPEIKSAILIAGDDGGQLKLDIPETEVHNLLQLVALRGRVLKITIEAE